jgi:hypothetical protein
MRRAAFALGLLLAAACRAAAQGPEAVAPLGPRATVAIEPPRLRLGEVAAVEILVVTPPEHRVHPVVLPESVPGLWLLDAETEPQERSAERWTQRTRVRVRAREVGPTAWPALRIDVDGPEGERTELETDARPLEVVSVLPDFPDRTATFPYRIPEADASRGPSWTAAAGGAAAALLGVAAIALARRARRARARAAAESPRAPEARSAALAELDAALAGGDWREAAGGAGLALRRYVTRRFGAPLSFRTTEEAEALAAPFGLSTRWPALLGVLRALDAARFRPDAGREAAGAARAAIADARRWVEGSAPPDGAR